MTGINYKNLTKFNRLIDVNSEYIKKDDYCVKCFPRIINDNDYLKSLSVSVAVLMEYYTVTIDKAIKCLTEGGRDSGIDLIYFDDTEIYENNGEKYIDLVIIQSKYKNNPESPQSAISEKDIEKTIKTTDNILNNKHFEKYNDLLTVAINRLKQIIEDNDFPIINCHIYFASNGSIEDKFSELACIKNVEASITCNFISNATFGIDKTVPIDSKLKIVGSTSLMQNTKDISGCIAETSLYNLVEFYDKYGKEALLSSNVRYLLPKSSINKRIKETALSTPELFWFYNNGISIISKSPLLPSQKTATDTQIIKLTEPNIINGGQTTACIYQAFKNKHIDKQTLEKAKVVVRIYYALNESIIHQIAQATNSQNPINVIDLMSGNPIQKSVVDFFAQKGVALIVKAGQDLTDYPHGQITNENLLQMYAAFYGEEPAKARAAKRTIFNKYFNLVFTPEEYANQMSEKLYRCFEFEQFLSKKQSEFCNSDKLFIDYAWYSLIYCMKLLNKNALLHNRVVNIKLWDELFETASLIIKEIITKRSEEMKENFSLNNLFKSKDIQLLIKNAVQK